MIAGEASSRRNKKSGALRTSSVTAATTVKAISIAANRGASGLWAIPSADGPRHERDADHTDRLQQ